MAGLSMARVGEEAGYARGSVYRYFDAKEELIIALAIESLELRLDLYERVGHFDARPRERFVALGEVTSLLHPRHAFAQIVGLADSLRLKTSEARQRRLREVERQDRLVVLAVAQDALDRGDLSLPEGLTLAETMYGISVLTRGIFNPVPGAASPDELEIRDPSLVMRRVGSHYLDGLGWRPLSSEWDYRATMRRIYNEIFTPEVLVPIEREIGGSRPRPAPRSAWSRTAPSASS